MKKSSYLCTRNRQSHLKKEWTIVDPAPVAELVDASDLGSGVSRRAGSSPVRRTPQLMAGNVKIAKREPILWEKDKKMQIF